MDHEGYVYVVDTANHAIRIVSPTGNVTTIAGTGVPGYKDSGKSGEEAQFSYPSDISFWRDWQNWKYPNPIDPDSFLERNANGRSVLFVADTGNHCIRKITGDIEYNDESSEKVWTNVNVTCFSGPCSLNPGPGYADGTSLEARFDSPRGLTVSSDGRVFVADTNNHLVRIIDRFGTVTTLAGSVTVAEVSILRDDFYKFWMGIVLVHTTFIFIQSIINRYIQTPIHSLPKGSFLQVVIAFCCCLLSIRLRS